MIINEREKPNCRGYAFAKLGIIQKEVNIESGCLKDFPFVEVKESKAIAIGVLMTDGEGAEPELMHIMIIDNNDRQYVWHRPDTGEEPVRESISLALVPYSDYPYSEYSRIVYLGRK